MYDDEREVVRHGGIEALCQHGETGMYDAMEDSSRSTIRPDEQG